MLPSTPVVIKFKCGKSATLPAHLLAKLPGGEAKVKSLPLVLCKDNVQRGELDMSDKFTVEQGVKLISYLCGGQFEPASYAVLKRAGVDVQRFVEEMFFEPPQTRLCLKNAGSLGAQCALALRDAQDVKIKQLSGDRCFAALTYQTAFGPGMPDSPYIECPITIPYVSRSGGNVKFIITRIGDAGHTYVLKAELPANFDVANMCRSVSMFIGGSQVDSIDFATNIALVKAKGLWPKRNNTPHKNSRWVATIPLMFSETSSYKRCAIPLIGLYNHEVCIELNGVAEGDLDFVIDLDYVFFDRPARAYIANGTVVEERPRVKDDVEGKRIKDDWSAPQSWTDAVSTICGVSTEKPEPKASMINQMVEQHQHQMDPLTAKIRLNMEHPTSGFIVMIKPNDPEMPEQQRKTAVPVKAATLYLNNSPAMSFDLADMSEWNWIKCGMKAPEDDFCTLLLPASRAMFLEDDQHLAPSTINMSRMDIVELRFELNEEVADMGWTVTTTGINHNVRGISTGMGGVLFA